MIATLSVSIPKLGMLVPVVVFVPDGDKAARRMETCARLAVVAMVRGQGGIG